MNKKTSIIAQSMSEVEYNNFKLEKMRYFDNKISHSLGYVAIVSSMIACFLALNTLSPKAFFNGAGVVLAILANIFILLTGFLTVEKVKNYSISYSKYMIGLGASSIARMFIYPLKTIIEYNKFVSDYKAGMKWVDLQIKYKSILGASIIEGKPTYVVDSNDGVISNVTTSGFLTANCNVRAILMITFLAISAACFIAGGVIGYIKSKKLEKYLSTLSAEEKKN